MTKPFIIGISGRRGVGKTTSANFLEYKYGHYKLSFADPLREIMQILFDMPKEYMEGMLKEEKCPALDMSYRELGIITGDFLRYVRKDYFISKLVARIMDIKGKKSVFVIDDVRRMNELEYIKSQGGVLIRIERYDKYLPFKTVISHLSETELDKYTDWDYTINECNNVEPDDLYKELDKIVESLRVKGLVK